jgi:hypothetical protein
MKDYLTRGNIKPYWTDEYKQFEYTRQPIKQSEIETWRSWGYTHNTFSGVMYGQAGGKNPMPDWVWDVADSMGLYNPGVVFYKMSCMEVMPNHEDHFETYCRVFGVERADVYRGLLMLEDWKSGHYLEMANHAYVNWNAGDYYVWSSDVVHAASNIGPEPRWTLQITGTRHRADT